jgi:hypothetical protein
MKSNADYKPILESLKTLKASGKVDIIWEGRDFRAEAEGHETQQVEFYESTCRIRLTIYKSDTLKSLGEKVIKAEELMDDLEMHIVYKKQNPNMYEFLHANLEL